MSCGSTRIQVVPFGMIHGGIVPSECSPGQRFGPTIGAVKFSVHSPSAERETAKEMDERAPEPGWQGAVVAVLGLYDKGKTFVLNHLTESKLPSGKKVSTKGLSFKHVDVEGTRFIVLDSEGSYAPVKVENEMSVLEKEISERFIQDVIFELGTYTHRRPAKRTAEP